MYPIGCIFNSRWIIFSSYKTLRIKSIKEAKSTYTKTTKSRTFKSKNSHVSFIDNSVKTCNLDSQKYDFLAIHNISYKGDKLSWPSVTQITYNALNNEVVAAQPRRCMKKQGCIYEWIL